jgi:hypothetical protein
MSDPLKLVPLEDPPPPAITFPDLRPELPLFERPWGLIGMPVHKCMYDGLPPGVYLLACPCPLHTTWCSL